MKQKRIVTMLLVFALIGALIPSQSFAKTLKVTNTSTTKNMYVGSTFRLKTNQSSASLAFSSSKPTVATVSGSGLIFAQKKGKATISVTSAGTTKKIKVIVKKPSGYTITKKSGTYTNSVSTTVKAKKGYTIYYSINNKFKKTQKINAKKSKFFTFAATKTLRLYPVKSTKKVTTVKLNKTKNTNPLRADYYYIISKSSSATPMPIPTVSTTPDSTKAPESSSIPESTATPLPLTTPGGSEFTGDDSSADYVAPSTPTYDDADATTTAASDAIDITIPTTATGSKTTEATYEISKKNKLTITAPGTYIIHTESTSIASDGLIEADFPDGTTGTVHIILDGVALTSSNNTAPTSDTGLITIKSSVTRAILTVKDGTETTLTDTGATGIDKDDSVSTTHTAGIVCKKIPLTINGTGALNISSVNGNGIKATETLKIIDTTIKAGSKTAPLGHNGITGKTAVSTSNANVTIYSTGDGLKTTLDEDDVAADSSLAELGNMDIEGGTYTIVSTDGDGISAYRTLNLNPVSLTITTQNASASTEDSSYKGVKAGTTIYIPATAGTITLDSTATYSASRSSGDSNDPVADDALHCDGCIRIDGGILNLAAGDDGIHSDTGLVINNGTITVSSSYEGLESGDITINGGTILVTSRDDGLNAAGGNDISSTTGGWNPGDNFNKGDSASSTNYQIIINGGSLTVNADGDGIDSNGSMFFKGGDVVINGPTNSGNGALDYGDSKDCVCEVSGGTLIAAGATGMDASPTSGSSQPTINVELSTSQSANTYVVLKDNSGNTVMTACPTKSFQSVVMSCSSLVLGNTYTIYYGKSLDNLTEFTTVTLTSTSVSTGSGSSSNPGGWTPGGGFHR